MPIPSDPSSSQSPLLMRVTSTLFFALIIFAGLWFAGRALAQPDEPVTTQTLAAQGVQPWPTLPATVTPQTVASGPAIVPTVTTPDWSEHLELTVIKFTLDSIQTVGEEEAKYFGINGRDQVTLRIVGEMRASIDLGQLKPSDVTREGDTISLVLPELKFDGLPAVIDIEELGSEQRFLGSKYAGLETQAIALARSEIYLKVTQSPDLKEIAQDAAVRRLTQFLTETAGFQDVTIRFAPEAP